MMKALCLRQRWYTTKIEKLILGKNRRQLNACGRLADENGNKVVDVWSEPKALLQRSVKLRKLK